MKAHDLDNYNSGVLHVETPYCKTCGAEEKELPRECPGRPMTQAERNAVAAGDMDFHDGTWHRTEKAKA